MGMCCTLGAALQKIDIKKYRKEKIKILQEDFLVTLTDDEIAHFNTLEKERQIDNYAREILNSRWQ